MSNFINFLEKYVIQWTFHYCAWISHDVCFTFVYPMRWFVSRCDKNNIIMHNEFRNLMLILVFSNTRLLMLKIRKNLIYVYFVIKWSKVNWLFYFIMLSPSPIIILTIGFFKTLSQHLCFNDVPRYYMFDTIERYIQHGIHSRAIW